MHSWPASGRMKMENRNMATLDDVLHEFVAENDRPTAENIQKWVAYYPHFEKELVDFAATWAEQLVLPEAPDLGDASERVLIDRAMSHVQNMAYHTSGAQAESPIQNLTGEAQRAGMDSQEFAKACGLDLALVSKLNSRMIEPATIPGSLVRHVARLIDRSFDAVANYLAMPPRNLAGNAYLARAKPSSFGRQSFADAVNASSLSDAEKRRWLDEGTDREGG